MTRQDVIKLFDLLEELYHGQRRPRTERVLAIWATVLGPWSYAAVRDAVISRARVNRHFPDPSEIAEFLPTAEAGKPSAESADSESRKNMNAEFAARAAEIQEVYHTAGLPTPAEAKRQGISYREWRDLVDRNASSGEVRP